MAQYQDVAVYLLYLLRISVNIRKLWLKQYSCEIYSVALSPMLLDVRQILLFIWLEGLHVPHKQAHIVNCVFAWLWKRE